MSFAVSVLLVVSSWFTVQDTPLFFSFDRDSFYAVGEWVPANPKDKPAFPSETEIDCFRGSVSCVEASAEYYVGYPHVAVDFFKIVKWDADGIIATSSNGICMTKTLLVTFAEKSISVTHSMKRLDDSKKEACKFFGAEKTEEDIFVLRGSARWNKEHTFLPDK